MDTWAIIYHGKISELLWDLKLSAGASLARLSLLEQQVCPERWSWAVHLMFIAFWRRTIRHLNIYRAKHI